MPTVTFLDAGTDQTFDTTFYPNQGPVGGATSSSASDQAHTGTRSYKLISPSGSPNSIFTGSPDGACTQAGTRCSFWVRFNAIPSTNLMFVSTWTTGFGDGPIGIGITTAGKLELIRDDNLAVVGAVGSTVLSANTWYRIGWTWVITSGTNWSCKVYINGVLEMTRGNADATLTFVDTAEFGPTITAATGSDTISGLTVWFDDVYIDNGTDLADPGAILVTAKRPFSNGTANGFTTQIGAGGSGYGSGHAPQVNERPLATGNGWSLSLTTKTTEEYTVEGLSVGDVDLTGATIQGVMGWIVADNASAADSPVGHIIVDGTASAITATTSPALYTHVSPNPTTYPAGTGTDIGIDGQYTTNPHLWSLFEAGILVGYLPSTFTVAQEAGIWAAMAGGGIIGRVDA